MSYILHITDMQHDFGAKEGVLAVPNGDVIAQRINNFMDELPNGVVSDTVVTYDSHFWFSYFSSPECIPFPAIHCEQDQKGWELVVDPSKLKDKVGRVLYGAKETFDFWQDKATTNVEIVSNGNQSALAQSFTKQLENDDFIFLPRDVKREEFGLTVGHDFEATFTPYTGKISVYAFGSSENSPKEGFYIRKADGKAPTVAAFVKNDLVNIYNNIGKISDDATCATGNLNRDKVISGNLAGATVIMTGLASNFCVFDAMLGYLQRGATVIVMEDLMAGIPNGPEAQEVILSATGVDRTASGDIRDVLKTEHFKNYVENGQLKLGDSKGFLEFARAKSELLRKVDASRYTP